MNKRIVLVLLAYAFLAAGMQHALAESRVNIVVAGYISHGPMQPTIDAIRNVTSKYGDEVNVTWLDMETAEGQKYMANHGLEAHLNILINGKYRYAVNGKSVTFQWFEGQQWTRNDLDAVILDLISGNGRVVEQDLTESGFPVVPIAMVLAVCAAIGGFYVYWKKGAR